MANANPPVREYAEPEDAHYASILDAFADLFMSPEAATPQRPDYGYMARIRDGQRIRNDFRKAIADLDCDSE